MARGQTIIQQSVPAGVVEDPRSQRVPFKRQAERRDDGEVMKIVCITEARPWIETEATDKNGLPVIQSRPMLKGEILTVPAWIGEALVSNDHAVKL